MNSLPTINSIGNIVISEDAALQTVNFSGVTAGGESQALIVTAISSDPSVIPNPNVTYFTPEATGSLSFAPVRMRMVTVRDAGLDNILGNTADGLTSTQLTVTVSVQHSGVGAAKLTLWSHPPKRRTFGLID